MGLRNDIQTDVGVAFDGDLADAVQSLTLIQVTSLYDLLSGENVNTETTVATRGAVTGFTNIEVFNESFQPTDVKILILQNELEAIPKIDDYIETATTKYKIIIVKQDPAGAHWELWGKV